jgi:hypothetical protein
LVLADPQSLMVPHFRARYGSMNFTTNMGVKLFVTKTNSKQRFLHGTIGNDWGFSVRDSTDVFSIV